MKAWKAELLLVVMTFIWGATFLFTKKGLDDCTPFLYIIVRFSIALGLSLLIFSKYLKQIDKKILNQGLILGAIFGGGFLLQTYGLMYTSVSNSAFITGITVVITPFIFGIVERKKVLLWQKLGVAIATPGLWYFLDPDFSNINFGDVLTLISTIFWAVYITYMDVYTRDRKTFDESALLVIIQFIGALPLAIIAFLLFEIDSYVFNLNENLMTSLAFNGIMASFIVTLIHTSVQKYSSPVKAALIFSLEPVVASILAMLAIGEVLMARQFIGGAVLLIGVMASETGEYFVNQILEKFSIKKRI